MRAVATTLAILLLATTAWAQGAQIQLTGGTVTGKARGQGTATVEARITNTGSAALLGVRIGTFYSTADVPPGPNADWRIHEFVFEPALQPGQGVALSFTDENAAEYIALEVRYAHFADSPIALDTGADAGGGLEPGVYFSGFKASLEHELINDSGTKYIAARDLVSIVGGNLGYDSATFEITYERNGRQLRFKTSERFVDVDGYEMRLAHKVKDIDGRSYLPLLDFAPLLGLKATEDGAVIQLEERD